jgi:uncharacterized protein YcfL
MRALILVAGAALAVSACSSNESADNTMNVDENLAAENIVANDPLATDANMTMNATDMNATGANATDANTTNAAEAADLTNNTADTNTANGI